MLVVEVMRWECSNFINDKDVKLIGCEAAGKGVDTALTAATIATGSLELSSGNEILTVKINTDQIAPVYSISAGLDYPGIGPETCLFTGYKTCTICTSYR